MNQIEDDTTDYHTEYDKYWSNSDRIGESSRDLEQTADQIVMSCGLGSTLDIGSGEGALVSALLRRGVDAHGLDVSEIVVSRCNLRLPSRFTHGSVLSLPFPDDSFSTVVSTDCLEHLASNDVLTALREMHRVVKRSVLLKIATTQDRDDHWHLTVEGRAWWESKCFEAGFRKHPAYYKINTYESLNLEGWQIVIPLEKIPRNTLSQYPLTALRKERDLHTDMLREHGSRSDAHVVRYHFACSYVRPGDTVLDAACGLGYGTHVLRGLSSGSVFRGIDGSEFAVDYANANFAMPGSVEFLQSYLPDCLTCLEDNSVDVIVSFETLEHVKNPDKLLKEFWRILTPGGRLITSVPNDWSDESGEDPNPYHFHVYNIPKLQVQIGAHFDIEHLFAQTANRVKVSGKKCEWSPRPRSWKEIHCSGTDQNIEAEWLLAVAAKSPLSGREVPYIEKMYTPAEMEAAGNALAFERDYENPWLVKSLISIGLRSDNKSLRAMWAQKTLEVSSTKSADRGAALCVSAYLHLDGIHIMPITSLFLEINQYIDICHNENNPNVFRWLVSLKYVQATIFIANGRREEAKNLLQWITDSPIISYHATLMTKVAEAAYLWGTLVAADGDFEAAKTIWEKAFHNLNRLLSQHLGFGYQQLPPNFEIRELSSVLALMGRLCVASKYAHELNSSPVLFCERCNADFVAQQHALVKERAVVSVANDALAEMQNYIDELLTGKEWLEVQWRATQEQLSQRDAELAEVLGGKEWLEVQWRATHEQLSQRDAELAKVQGDNEWLRGQWRAAQDQLDWLKNTFGFRLLRKLKLIVEPPFQTKEMPQVENNRNIDVTLLITFHREGVLAHSTLNSIERCRKFAENAGITTEYVWVLDSIDEETRSVLLAHPAKSNNIKIVDVSHNDAGASRNSGIAVSSGTAIAILDGDDYFSTNWIERAWHYLKMYGPSSILHPEFVVNFGTQLSYCWQVDQCGQYFDRAGLLVGNYWTSWTFALRSVYERCPYATTRAVETGFGYEDWHWNCETIASGYKHRLAWGSIGFYRKKRTSRVTSDTEIGAIIPPTLLFSKGSVSEVLK